MSGAGNFSQPLRIHRGMIKLPRLNYFQRRLLRIVIGGGIVAAVALANAVMIGVEKALEILS